MQVFVDRRADHEGRPAAGDEGRVCDALHSDTDTASADQRNDEQHQEDDEQHLCDPGCIAGNSAKAEHGRHQSDNQKQYCPVKHGSLSVVRDVFLPGVTPQVGIGNGRAAVPVTSLDEHVLTR